jgi:hypothetical protein
MCFAPPSAFRYQYCLCLHYDTLPSLISIRLSTDTVTFLHGRYSIVGGGAGCSAQLRNQPASLAVSRDSGEGAAKSR